MKLIEEIILTFSLVNILLESQRNSMMAVMEARVMPMMRTRKAPATFSTVRALAVEEAASRIAWDQSMLSSFY